IAGVARFGERGDGYNPIITLAKHNKAIRSMGGKIRLVGELNTMPAYSVVSMEIEITNGSDAPWESDGLRPVRLCYRWLDSVHGGAIVAEGVRSNMGMDVPLGEAVRTWMTVKSPDGFKGEAILRLVPVQEGVGWFDQMGNLYQDIAVSIG